MMVRIQYTDKISRHTVNQDLGFAGIGEVDLRSGLLSYVYEITNIEDGHLPINLSLIYDRTFAGNFEGMGRYFKLNLQQSFVRQPNSVLDVYTDAMGRRHFFNSIGVNEPLGLLRYTPASGRVLVDDYGNSLVFDSRDRLVEIHQFPSRRESPIVALRLNISYIGTTGRISEVTNGRTTLAFIYDLENRLHSILRNNQVQIVRFEYTADRLVQMQRDVGSDTLHITRLSYVTRAGFSGNFLSEIVCLWSFSRVRYAYLANREKIAYVNVLTPASRSSNGDMIIFQYGDVAGPVPANDNQIAITWSTTLVFGQYRRRVSFSGNDLISDYTYRLSGSGAILISTFSNGFDYLAFKDIHANQRDIVADDHTGHSFITTSHTFNYNSSQLLGARLGVHNYAITVWVRQPHSQVPVTILVTPNSNAGLQKSYQINNQINSWQLVTIALEDVANLNALSIRFTSQTSSLLEVGLISVVQLPRAFTAGMASEFAPRYDSTGRLRQLFSYNPIDDTITMLEYTYNEGLGGATLVVFGRGNRRYPGSIRGVVEYRAPGTVQNVNEFAVQRTRFRRTDYFYQSNRQLIEVRTQCFRTSEVQEVVYLYDSAGALILFRDVSGVITRISRESNGAVTTTVVGDGNSPDVVTTNNFHLGTGRLMSTTTGGEITSFTYDSLGNLTGLSRGSVGDTSLSPVAFFTYNQGALVSIGVPNHTLMSFSRVRNTHGNLIANVTTFGNGHSIRQNLLDNGNISSIVRANADQISTIDFTYLSNGHLRQISQPLSGARMLNYTFYSQQAGNLRNSNIINSKHISNGINTVVAKNYGGRDRLTQAYYLQTSSGLMQMSRYNTTVNSLGNLVSLDRGGRGDITYITNNLGQTTARNIRFGGVTFFETNFFIDAGLMQSQLRIAGTTFAWTYFYHANGNVRSIGRNNVAYQRFSYDASNRLSKFENLANGRTYNFVYDIGGNITSVMLGDTVISTYAYSSVWRDLLTNFNGYSIIYDGAGNPLTWRDGMTMSWQNGRELRQVAGTPYGTITMQYDYAGRRISKHRSSDNLTIHYFWHGDKLIAESRGANMIWFHYDERGISGMTLNGNDYFFERNLFGDVVAIFSTNGVLQGIYSYCPWGQGTVTLAANTDDVMNINPFRYRGYYYDHELGMYYLMSRYYDPVVRRFINADDARMLYIESLVAGSGSNLFAYALNNPVMFADPSGYGVIATAVLVAIVAAALLSSPGSDVLTVANPILSFRSSSGRFLIAGSGNSRDLSDGWRTFTAITGGLLVGAGAVIFLVGAVIVFTPLSPVGVVMAMAGVLIINVGLIILDSGGHIRLQ